MAATIRIVGFDPGLRRTGFGIIDVTGNALAFVACGTVTSTDTLTLAERLAELYAGLTQVMSTWHPDEAAVEQTFVNKDASATLKLGQARGIAMLVPALAGLRVAEYEPNRVKKSVVGAGHADKTQIHAMVNVLLPKANPRTTDAADALAIAITHAHFRASPAVRLA